VITGRDERRGAAAQRELRGGAPAHFVAADVAEADRAIDAVDRAVALLGRLDLLVNNAGIGVVAGVLDTSLDAFDAVMDVNLRGAFITAKAAFPHLEATGGSMIHVASDAGVSGEAEIAVYSVSKAALIMLSNMLAIEGGRRGVRSNAVCPGDTEPGMIHMTEPGADERPDDPSTWPVPPVGRIGRASDVAEAVVYLASERASFVNGVALLVDGGMRAGMRTGGPPASRGPG
jgi:NAD(P)-dependent dehydrogenase (short-subunit alcohol dehydrogenase family)